MSTMLTQHVLHQLFVETSICCLIACTPDMIYSAVFCIVMSFANSNAVGMVKERSAGLLVFRRANSRIEYLLLKASERDKIWSAPKGCTF